MKILVVEDNVRLGEVIEHTLKKAGHDVTFVQCLQHGIQKLRHEYHELDLIITDVQLPVWPDRTFPIGSGLDIARVLAETEGDPKPLYVHSSSTSDFGTDIIQWLAEHYPTAMFNQKLSNDELTAAHALTFVEENDTA